MKRLVVVLPLVLMLTTLFPASTLANTGQCVTPAQNSIVTGQHVGTTFHGVSSYLQPHSVTTLDACNGGLWMDNDGASAWVALVPTVCGYGCNSTNAIVQIGIANCRTVFPNSGCTDGADSKFQYFVAEGGCHTIIPTLTKVGNGTTASANHKYWIELRSNRYLDLYVDSTLMKTYDTFDLALSCWAEPDLYPNNLSIQFDGETWDRGDSLGDNNYPTTFSGMNYKSASTDYWIHFNFSSPDCNTVTNYPQDDCLLGIWDPGYRDAMYLYSQH